MNVYQKLNAAREAFHALALKKTGKNTFAGYEYFELGDFLLPALKCFREAGLCGVVSFNGDTAKMCVVNVDKPDEYIPIESPMGSAALKGCHEVQNIGAVETYQRRYLWVAALEIVEHDALDASTGSGSVESKKKPGPAHRPANGGAVDMSPKARAQRIAAGVAGGDAAGAALALSEWDRPLLDSVWALLDAETQDKLTAAWPQTEKA